MKKIKSIILTFILIFNSNFAISAEKIDLLKVDWSFNGLFGTFDRGSLQRGYQVYTEVCASCHSMKHLSYRNLSQPGGPEFSKEQVKIIIGQAGRISVKYLHGPTDGTHFGPVNQIRRRVARKIKLECIILDFGMIGHLTKNFQDM